MFIEMFVMKIGFYNKVEVFAEEFISMEERRASSGKYRLAAAPIATSDSVAEPTTTAAP